MNKHQVNFNLNGSAVTLEVEQNDTLLFTLRQVNCVGVKDGCSQGDCGVCTVLVDGEPMRSCVLQTLKMEGRSVETIEGISDGHTPHPIQQAFMDCGAIQCGYCTPAMVLTAKALLDRNDNPTEAEVRESLAGVKCRCTGYNHIIEAVLRAGAILRGEDVPPVAPIHIDLPGDLPMVELPSDFCRVDHPDILPPLVYTPKTMAPTAHIGQPQTKVDAKKLVMGKPAYTDDIKLEGMLYGDILTSPHAHARIIDIRTDKAKAIPGVHAVLTYKDVPRVKYASGGQSYPQPLPYDQVSLDNKVRHVGDRVAIVAAETPELARKALRMIEVDYEVLPHALNMDEALAEGAPIIHDELDTEGIHDANRNIVNHIEAEEGDVDQAFTEADQVFEGMYFTPKQHHAQSEPHTCITYWDADDRLVVRTSTQVPFHVRRIISPLIGLPVKQIRVIKPRIGGGFGGKQEILLEDLCSHLTIATGRPVRMFMSRRFEFIASRSRHPHKIHYKVGLKDKTVTAIELRLIGDTGAYGSHALTVQMVGGFKGLTLYNAPNARFICDTVYTNTVPAGAYRGYGSMQEQFGIEVLMEEISEKIGMDPIEFKYHNVIKVGEPMYLAKKLGEGREGFDQAMNTSAHEEALFIGAKATDFYKKRKEYAHQTGDIRKGIGFAVVFHGSGIAGLDMASATMKMNDDGSFNLLVGATDIGTGSDTILAQIAAEVLDMPVEDIIVYSSDTDFTPFDKGAYASSTTYISGGAVRKTALKIKKMVLEHAALMLGLDTVEGLVLKNKTVVAGDGMVLTFEEIGLSSLHQMNQHQIIASASHMSLESPPPTAVQFAEIEVDIRTGEIKPTRLLMLVDCGRVMNPQTAAGQVTGGMAQALGFAHCEETYLDENGDMINDNLDEYHTYSSNEMPDMDVIFIQTDEPTGPYGAKSISEIAIDGVGPAMVSALHNATGKWVRTLPLTPERVWKALRE
ncbi:MAG: molybdopterin cofactor-binding domain-containing protein [Anaerolineae bacterium]|jgi:putative selenate reductase molybdopterin-binding subunit|nr:molybdopterin cofactor-binding domain-containing protein [Anaerolineae bacterium]